MHASLPCPDADHAGSRVVRHGSCGPLGRQRYRCVPVDGRPHTFSVLAGFPEDHSGPPPADVHLRAYRHGPTEIADALVSIGRGASYRQAAIRASAGASANGQLVANWVRTFGPLVVAPATSLRWPPVLCVGAFSLRREATGRAVPAGVTSGGLSGDCLMVQLAIGLSPSGAPDQMCDARVAERGGKGEWSAFFERRGGRPHTLIVERGSDAAAGALRYWAADPPLLVEARRWPRPDVEGHGGPDPATGTGGPPDVPAFTASFNECRQALFRRLAPRLSHFSDRGQLDQLLALMRMDLNGDADATTYASRILLAAAEGRRLH